MLKVGRKIQSKTPVLFMCVAGLLTLILLSGCTLRTPSMNKLDSLTFSANFKADVCANYGKKAAYRDGRIYYLSAEMGTQGIYSMNSKGEDITLEIPVEDVRAVSAQPDGLYYAGFDAVKQNDNGTYRQFRLFQMENGSNEPLDLLKTFSIQDDLGDVNVWDFFLAVNGTFAITFVDISGYPPSPRFTIACFKNSKAVTNSEYSILEDRLTVPSTSANQNKVSLSSLDGLYFLSYDFNQKENGQDQTRDGVYHIGCFDTDSIQSIASVDRYLTNIASYGDSSGPRGFTRITGKKFILSSTYGLESLNVDANEIRDMVTFDSPEFLYQTIDLGGKILIFTENFRGSYFLDDIASSLFCQNRALKENLYRFDPETGDISRLLSVGRNNAFLYADAKTAVTGGGKTISIYDISGDKAELLRKIEIEHNIVDRANKADNAGGWMFLYRFNEQTQRDELIEKVYIGS